MDSELQKKVVLDLLRTKPMSTFELRDSGVPHPAGRIRELRMAGHKIATVLASDTPDHRGNLHHSVAKYSLIREAAQ